MCKTVLNIKNFFYSILKESHNNLISNEILDLWLNINLNSLIDKNKYNDKEVKKFLS